MSLTPAIVILSPPGADEESLFEAESQSAVIPSAREVRFVDSGGVRRTLGTGGSAFSCFCGCPILRAVREGWVRILVFVFNLAPACPERVEGLALSLEGASARHPFRCWAYRAFCAPVDSAERGVRSASRMVPREIPPSPLLSDVIPRSPPATEGSAVAFVVIPSETKCSEESLIAFSCGVSRPRTPPRAIIPRVVIPTSRLAAAGSRVGGTRPPQRICIPVSSLRTWMSSPLGSRDEYPQKLRREFVGFRIDKFPNARHRCRTERKPIV